MSKITKGVQVIFFPKKPNFPKKRKKIVEGEIVFFPSYKKEVKKNIRILILEDDLETVEKILATLRNIENEGRFAFAATVIPDYIQVDELINKNPQVKFDVLLLDRDCFLGGSFHNVNLKNFDLDKVISISSVPEYNEEAQKLGVRRVILKDYSNLSVFSGNLERELMQIIGV